MVASVGMGTSLPLIQPNPGSQTSAPFDPKTAANHQDFGSGAPTAPASPKPSLNMQAVQDYMTATQSAALKSTAATPQAGAKVSTAVQNTATQNAAAQNAPPLTTDEILRLHNSILADTGQQTVSMPGANWSNLTYTSARDARVGQALQKDGVPQARIDQILGKLNDPSSNNGTNLKGLSADDVATLNHAIPGLNIGGPNNVPGEAPPPPKNGGGFGIFPKAIVPVFTQQPQEGVMTVGTVGNTAVGSFTDPSGDPTAGGGDPMNFEGALAAAAAAGADAIKKNLEVTVMQQDIDAGKRAAQAT